MTITFTRIDPSGRDRDELVRFMTGFRWPMHMRAQVTAADVEESIAEGAYDDEDNKSFWIDSDEHGRVGFVRLEDLTDPTPLFDLRLAEKHRGKGLGLPILKALTDHVFVTMPAVDRFEGQTRDDNVAMRRTFVKAGWVKEAHYRRGWPVDGGEPRASVAYVMLRQDWENGTTTPVPWDDLPMEEDPSVRGVLVDEARMSLTGGPVFRVDFDVKWPKEVTAINDSVGVLPKKRGLYAVYAKDVGVVRAALGQEIHVGDDGLLYLGKAEKSLQKRDVRQHFGVGKTSRSTLRRTFAALLVDELKLRPVPKKTSSGGKGPKSFDLDKHSDLALSAWMSAQLELHAWVPTECSVALGEVEQQLIKELLPPLNLTHAGSREYIKSARARMVELAGTASAVA